MFPYYHLLQPFLLFYDFISKVWILINFKHYVKYIVSSSCSFFVSFRSKLHWLCYVINIFYNNITDVNLGRLQVIRHYEFMPLWKSCSFFCIYHEIKMYRVLWQIEHSFTLINILMTVNDHMVKFSNLKETIKIFITVYIYMLIGIFLKRISLEKSTLMLYQII